MLDTQVKTKEAQNKILPEKVTELRRQEIETRLNQLGMKSPGYLRDMMDNGLKDVDMCFFE